MRLLARIVLSGCLNGKASLGAGSVKVAVVIHSLLERVAFPSEDVIAMSGRATKEISALRNADIADVARTYPRFMEYTNGSEPSVGHKFLSANLLTSHITSYMTCGSLTGWVEGHAPPPLAPDPWPYATWLV